MRELNGPDFDDRLIRLVRDNPAIYDVNHEHYRRYQVRVALWERFAKELGTTSKFLQTKWKNIRYNYLQEIKCLETGIANSNVRKRRFTEDLSFLQNTAQIYKKPNTSYNGSDDSNGYLYTDTQYANSHEVADVDNSDDDAKPFNFGAAADYDADAAGVHETFPFLRDDCYNDEDDEKILTVPAKRRLKSENTPNSEVNSKSKIYKSAEMPPPSPVQSNASVTTPPLLEPIVTVGNEIKDDDVDDNDEVQMVPNGETLNSKHSASSSSSSAVTATVVAKTIAANATKRKSMPAPFPVLTPINDPIEMYCLSLVDSLRNMARSERERVKFEFAKILKDAKYKDQS